MHFPVVPNVTDDRFSINQERMYRAFEYMGSAKSSPASPLRAILSVRIGLDTFRNLNVGGRRYRTPGSEITRHLWRPCVPASNLSIHLRRNALSTGIHKS